MRDHVSGVTQSNIYFIYDSTLLCPTFGGTKLRIVKESDKIACTRFFATKKIKIWNKIKLGVGNKIMLLDDIIAAST
jgi:hypothetical protein